MIIKVFYLGPWMEYSSKPKVLLALYWYNQDVRIGVAKYACEQGWDLVVDQGWSTNYRNSGTDWDGIITQYNGDPDYWHYVSSLNVPKVSVGHVPDKSIPAVEADEETLAYAVADFMLKRGFKNFLCFSPEHGYKISRMVKFSERIKAHEANSRNISIPEGLTDYKKFPMESLVDEVQKVRKPGAVFVANDQFSLLVFEACKIAGFKVPSDVAIIGTDNDTSYCEITPVPLTSVDQATSKQGYEAARMVDRLMQGKQCEVRKLIKPKKVVARKSTDIYLLEDKAFPNAMFFIRNNYQDNISVEHIADYCKISTRKLYQVFKEKLEKTPRFVVLEIRLKRAKMMLAESDESLRAIAEKCGFSTNHNLYVTFKRELNMTPTAYRQQAGR